MKKGVLILLALLLCFSLTSCDPMQYQFDYEELESKVLRVELIEYENPDQKSFLSWVPDHSDDLLPFDASKVTLQGELEGSQMSAFLRQLSQMEMMYKYYFYDSPNGACLRLTYRSGEFLIVSRKHICLYSKTGEVVDFIGTCGRYEEFDALAALISAEQ